MVWRHTYAWAAMFAFLILTGCGKEPSELEDQPYFLSIPPGFSMPNIPEDNLLTEKRIELGKLLFFDPGLSEDSSVSCGSCHFQAHAFSDNKALSTGIYGRTGFRNSPPLFNLAWHNKFFKDGGVPTLELQVLAPIEDENEMNFNVPDALARLSQNPTYQHLAKIAYGRDFDAFVLTRSIAAYERTLVSGNSAYDKYQFQGDNNALTDQEKRGLTLFNSARTQCSSCHSGFDFSDYEFYNIGLYTTYADTGRMRITLNPADNGRFKTPSLRNIELTAPYMHDGSLATLEDVIEHFNSGGMGHPNQDSRVKPLNLTESEQADLIAFLKSLTDESFINNTKFALSP